MNKCKTILFGNSKGGVGKSSSVQTTGVILSQLGYKVLCVDNDPQSHLSVSCNIQSPESLPITLTNLYERVISQDKINSEIVNQAIIKTNTIDLLPSTFNMDKLDFGLNSITDREYALADILEPVKSLYDYILIDCNSSNNIFTINALSCANELVLPCQTQYLSMGGIPLMLSSIKAIKKRINPQLQLKGILLTMYQSNTNQSKQTVDLIRREYEDLVFDSIIPMSTKVPDAQKQGMSVIELDKNNPVSLAYNDFVKKELIA